VVVRMRWGAPWALLEGMALKPGSGQIAFTGVTGGDMGNDIGPASRDVGPWQDGRCAVTLDE
jgi:hypothetical protein